MNRRVFLRLLVQGSTIAAIPSVAFAAFDWNGVWVGKAANGRITEITISKGKITSWKSNGKSQEMALAEIKDNVGTIKHVEGASVTLTPAKDGTLVYAWKGKSGSSKVTLVRR